MLIRKLSSPPRRKDKIPKLRKKSKTAKAEIADELLSTSRSSFIKMLSCRAIIALDILRNNSWGPIERLMVPGLISSHLYNQKPTLAYFKLFSNFTFHF
jgi:hypothetical protein